MPANYDIKISQGDTLTLHLLYQDVSSNSIDLANYEAEMQVRRSPDSSSYLLYITSNPNGLTYGITGSTGGIRLNRNKGNTGSETGGILLSLGATATSYVPHGKHHYDIEIRNTATGVVTKLIQGNYDSIFEITKL